MHTENSAIFGFLQHLVSFLQHSFHSLVDRKALQSEFQQKVPEMLYIIKSFLNLDINPLRKYSHFSEIRQSDLYT